MVLACPDRGGRYGGGRSWLATEVRRRSLVCGKKERGKEVTQVAGFSLATLSVVTGVDGVDGVTSRWWRDVRWRHGHCGVAW